MVAKIVIIFIVLNGIIFCFGVAVVVLAFFVVVTDQYTFMLLGKGIMSLPIIILIIGVNILLMSLIGVLGVLMKNKILLQSFSGIVLILLMMQIIMGMLILIFRNESKEIALQAFDMVFKQYGNGDEKLQESIDYVHQMFECCGVRNYTDWKFYPFGINGSVPDGCCKKVAPHCGIGMTNLHNPVGDKIFTYGCYQAISHLIHSKILWLGALCIVLAISQVINAACAFVSAKEVSSYI